MSSLKNLFLLHRHQTYPNAQHTVFLLLTYISIVCYNVYTNWTLWVWLHLQFVFFCLATLQSLNVLGICFHCLHVCTHKDIFFFFLFDYIAFSLMSCKNSWLLFSWKKTEVIYSGISKPLTGAVWATDVALIWLNIHKVEKVGEKLSPKDMYSHTHIHTKYQHCFVIFSVMFCCAALFRLAAESTQITAGHQFLPHFLRWEVINEDSCVCTKMTVIFKISHLIFIVLCNSQLTHFNNLS